MPLFERSKITSRYLRNGGRSLRRRQYRAIAINGNIVAERGVRPADNVQFAVYKCGAKQSCQEVAPSGVCVCQNNLAVDIFCPLGCLCNIHPQFHCMEAKDIYRALQWYLYNIPTSHFDSPSTLVVEKTLYQLELVEKMLPSSLFFTDDCKASTIYLRSKAGRVEELRMLPPGVAAGGSECAGRSRIRKHLLPGVLENLTSLLNERIPFHPIVPVHLHTLLNRTDDDIVVKGLFGPISDLEKSAVGKSWVVVKGYYLVRRQYARLVSEMVDDTVVRLSFTAETPDDARYTCTVSLAVADVRSVFQMLTPDTFCARRRECCFSGSKGRDWAWVEFPPERCVMSH